ncbi:energy transducer TonB [Hymenobacter siberiensis]|uniref:energy transducer TonB n=1 Tax=Hymenobacter siberiensis TaxID=2848396 RepID=UPI001C1E464C
MKKIFICAAAALLLAPAASVLAQAPTPPAAYAGPRFPGGPDSLRALMGRSMRQAGATPAGRMLVQFELKADGQPTNYTMVRPPEPLSKPLVEATATALNYLEAHMPAWQPAPPDPEASPKNQPARISLVLDFTTPLAAQPYAYADQNPVFGTLAQALPTRRNSYFDKILNDPARRARFESSGSGLVACTQMAVKYPPEALRAHQQGTVYAAFEVSETGALEHTEILGSAGNALDATVRQAIGQLPAATTPAQLNGRPVRMSYVLPITFKIQ